MLSNGITLAVKIGSAETYTNLDGLKEVPELGIDPEKVENTGLGDSVKQYEFGIGDAGDLAYKFKFKNSADTDAYRVLRTLADAKTKASFKQTLPDGTTFTFDAQSSIKVSGGGINNPIDFTLNLALQSDIVVGDKA